MLGEESQQFVIVLLEGVIYLGADGAGCETDAGEDAAGALVEDCQIVAAIVEAQYILPPFLRVLLEDVVLAQLLSDHFLPPILHFRGSDGVPAILPSIEAVLLQTVAAAAGGGVGHLEVD